MPTGNRRWIQAAAALLVAVAVAGLWISQSAEPQFDRHFDTGVARPAYTQAGPLVQYDEGHLNTHTADRGYRPFADLVRNDGYRFRIDRHALSTDALADVAVLVIVCARGANDANDAPAFSDAEGDALEQWVRGGGGLLLITDHWPYGTAVDALARRFGIGMGQGLVEDPAHADPTRGESHIVFSRENGLLVDHPILRGRAADERIQRVLTFTGQSLSGPAGAVGFLTLSGAAVERPSTTPRVDRKGGDVRVSMEYADPVPAAGRAQGIAMEFGSGRIVVLADAGMLRAQRERDGTLTGMNAPGYDNRQLAMNIMHWLSRAS